MNPLLQFAIREMDKKCVAWEERSETDHRIPDGVEEVLDVPFQGEGDCPLAVDIFRPKAYSASPLPAVIMVHGGGLVVGTRKLSRSFCENLAELGFLVFAPDYRLVPEADALGEIGDVFAALSFVSGALAAYGGDPDRVALASESAGSFLSVYASAAAASPLLREAFGLSPAPPLTIRGLACFSGMFYTARKDGVGLLYTGNLYGERKKDPAFMRFMNPEDPGVMDALPPLFLVGSEADFLHGYTERYAAALRRAGHPCELVYFQDNPALTHAFPALKPDLPESREVLLRLAQWLRNLW